MKLISELLSLREAAGGDEVVLGFNKHAYLLATNIDLDFDPATLIKGKIKQVAFPEGTLDKYAAELVKAGVDQDIIDEAKEYMITNGEGDPSGHFQIFEIDTVSDKELGKLEGKMENASDDVGYVSTIIRGPLTVKKLADYLINDSIYGSHIG